MFGFVACFLILSLAVFWLLERLERGRVMRDRLAHLAPTVRLSARREQLRRSLVERMLGPYMAFWARLGERLMPARRRSRALELLEQAGHEGPEGLSRLLAVRALGLCGGAAVFLLVTPLNATTGYALAGGLVLIGALGPDAYLKRRIRHRQGAMTRSLPDVLDHLTACVEAGLGFDAAVQRLASRPSEHGRDLKQELSRYLSDVRLGQDRAEALRDLGRRCGTDEMKGVVAALLQAEHLGVAIGPVLRAHAAHLRTRRRQRAQEAAMKAPVKMLFPLVFFIFPAMFVVILGPAALRMMDMFATLQK